MSVGLVESTTVGVVDGELDWTTVGVIESITVGVCDGKVDGPTDGHVVGDIVVGDTVVGSTDGASEGSPLGPFEGW